MSGLETILSQSPVINGDRQFILFSDCHRGVGDWAGDFSHNQLVFFHALSYYYQRDYTYIEVGDGDECWENRGLKAIQAAHSDVFWMLGQFLVDGRLYMLTGNHNQVDYAELSTVIDRDGNTQPLLEEMAIHEGIALEFPKYGKSTRVLVTHGHQADRLSCFPLSQFFVRYLWRPMQIVGVRDPTSPATSDYRRNKVESKLREWVERSGTPLICGHTHRPRVSGRYFNTGSCVHPRAITGIEIEDGRLSLIKWSLGVEHGVVRVKRSLLVNPVDIRRLNG